MKTNNAQQPRYSIEGQKKGEIFRYGDILHSFKEVAKDKKELDLLIELIKEDSSIVSASYIDKINDKKTVIK